MSDIRLEILPEANKALLRTIEQYKELEPSLGSRFRYDAMGFMDVIRIHPTIFEPNDIGIRSVKLSSEFPYHFDYYFDVENEKVTILSLVQENGSVDHAMCV